MPWSGGRGQVREGERSTQSHTGVRSFSPAPPSIPTHAVPMFYFLACNEERINGKDKQPSPFRPQLLTPEPPRVEQAISPQEEQAPNNWRRAEPRLRTWTQCPLCAQFGCTNPPPPAPICPCRPRLQWFGASGKQMTTCICVTRPCYTAMHRGCVYMRISKKKDWCIP